ncbi:hypothetical protein [Telluribacter sp. SYSU D00476]|uniref:hypothetical protein n=1 Tax=Telluribacter sp. SYSU D00476 TaxID=2811430 RepID=UPI001FF4D0E8|nr:hypothetical protein [Telluribacter sp. SYSU D00476]
MKNRAILIILSLLLFTGITPSQAQSYQTGSYQTGVGIRMGNTGGISVKHFMDGRHAVEGILSARWGGIGVTGLMEWHKEAFRTERLNFYYGFGGHVYLGRYQRYRRHYYYESRSAIGIDGILGLEYHLPRAPITGSLDWKPAINLIGRTGYHEGGLALTVRYAF